MTNPRFESTDLTATNIDKIAEMFPGVVTEGKINFDLLRSLLGDEVYGDEAYEFTWVGKRAAIAEAGSPIRKTLCPCIEESKNWDTTENLYIDPLYNTDMDLLYACLLDWCLPLSMPHTQEKIGGFTVHTYNDGDLSACFDKHISDEVVKEIAKRQPLRAVFRDVSFASSPEKINVEEIFKLLAPNTGVKVL